MISLFVYKRLRIGRYIKIEYYPNVCLTVCIIRVGRGFTDLTRGEVEKGGFKRNICSSILVMRILHRLTHFFLDHCRLDLILFKE